MISWLNGELGDVFSVQSTRAGLLLGWGVFTTIGIWNARPFALENHLARLRHDAERAGIEYSFADETLLHALTEVFSRNDISRGTARITLTQRGGGRWNLEQGSDCSILALPLPTSIQSARLALSPFRLHSQRATAGMKSTSYLDYQLAWQEAQSRGFDETVLLNENGHICEGARSNVFWTRNGELFTPALSTGCLPGIARSLVMAWARQDGIVVHEVEYLCEVLSECDSLFLTSSATGVREVAVFSERETAFGNCELINSLKDLWTRAVSA